MYIKTIPCKQIQLLSFLSITCFLPSNLLLSFFIGLHSLVHTVLLGISLFLPCVKEYQSIGFLEQQHQQQWQQQIFFPFTLLCNPLLLKSFALLSLSSIDPSFLLYNLVVLLFFQTSVPSIFQHHPNSGSCRIFSFILPSPAYFPLVMQNHHPYRSLLQ